MTFTRICGKLIHFEVKCQNTRRDQETPYHFKKPSVRAVNETGTENSPERSSPEENDELEYARYICAGRIASVPLFYVTICGHSLTVLADSGASVNIMSVKDYDFMINKPLDSHSKYVYAYGSDTTRYKRKMQLYSGIKQRSVRGYNNSVW